MKRDALTHAVQEAMVAWSIPGAAVSIAAPGDFRWSAGFGLADREHGVPVTPDTVFRLASISKPITAVAVMQQVERGRLELDAPIQRYVPMYPEKPWPITCRQILGHLSGISSLPEALDTALLYEPGTAFQYGSTAYTLLARAIEAVSGLDFLTCVRRNVLEPAGMAHTDADAGSRIVPNRARGYAWDEEASVFRIADDADIRDHLAGGGFCGTADDIVRFGLALHEGRLLGAKACEEMWTRLRLTGGRQTRYGLGWFAWNYRGEREVAHGGKYNGFSNMFSLRPASDVVVVLLTNRHGLNSSHMHALTRQLGDIAMT